MWPSFGRIVVWAENSIAVYAPCARDFFTYCVTQVGHLALQLLEADTVRTFLLGRIANGRPNRPVC